MIQRWSEPTLRLALLGTGISSDQVFGPLRFHHKNMSGFIIIALPLWFMEGCRNYFENATNMPQMSQEITLIYSGHRNRGLDITTRGSGGKRMVFQCVQHHQQPGRADHCHLHLWASRSSSSYSRPAWTWWTYFHIWRWFVPEIVIFMIKKTGDGSVSRLYLPIKEEMRIQRNIARLLSTRARVIQTCIALDWGG